MTLVIVRRLKKTSSFGSWILRKKDYFSFSSLMKDIALHRHQSIKHFHIFTPPRFVSLLPSQKTEGKQSSLIDNAKLSFSIQRCFYLDHSFFIAVIFEIRSIFKFFISKVKCEVARALWWHQEETTSVTVPSYNYKIVGQCLFCWWFYARWVW